MSPFRRSSLSSSNGSRPEIILRKGRARSSWLIFSLPEPASCSNMVGSNSMTAPDSSFFATALEVISLTFLDDGTLADECAKQVHGELIPVFNTLFNPSAQRGRMDVLLLLRVE